MVYLMESPAWLDKTYAALLEEKIARFMTEAKMISSPRDLASSRFLSRSVLPHVERLTGSFNRKESSQDGGIKPYWGTGSNSANLRMSYFLYYMPSNMARMTGVWHELWRLGYKWRGGEELRAVDFGSGPATAAIAIATAEANGSSIDLPRDGSWALIERDGKMLDIGSAWATTDAHSFPWTIKTFRREINATGPLLPRGAPKFNLWTMCYMLNESDAPVRDIARALADAWERHLDDEGLCVIVEPALKLQSRKLLSLRAELLKLEKPWLKVLLPCLGHQDCGALADRDGEDWCHEEISWWRPPYMAKLDTLAGLDHKSLPFSYLVIAKSARTLTDILPELGGDSSGETIRLVSPVHFPTSNNPDAEFFSCSARGKLRCRLKCDRETCRELGRGAIIKNALLRGDANCTRVETGDG